MSPFMTRTVTLVQRVGRLDVDENPVRDARGNQLVDQQLTDITGCEWQPAGGSESTAFRDQVSDELTLYSQVDFPGKPADAVLIGGVEYEITSPIARWDDPALGYAKMTLTRTTG